MVPINLTHVNISFQYASLSLSVCARAHACASVILLVFTNMKICLSRAPTSASKSPNTINIHISSLPLFICPLHLTIISSLHLPEFPSLVLAAVIGSTLAFRNWHLDMVTLWFNPHFSLNIVDLCALVQFLPGCFWSFLGLKYSQLSGVHTGLNCNYKEVERQWLDLTHKLVGE